MCAKHFALTLLLLISLLVGCKQQLNPKPQSDNGPSNQMATQAKPTQSAVGSMYFDSFTGMADSKRLFKNGSIVADGQGQTRVVHAFADNSKEPLVLQVFEDSKSIGADGFPGVMSLSWQTLPSVLSYSGFVYQRASDSIRLPYIAMAKSVDELNDFELRFRYKGVNPNSENVSFLTVCRIEHDVPDSYPIRIELSAITVTDQWQEFIAKLGEGKNAHAFLDSMQRNDNHCFKIVWSQIGPIASYRPGDTLLIDDLDIVDLKNRPKIENPQQYLPVPNGTAATTANETTDFQPVEGLHPLDLSSIARFRAADFQKSQAYPWPVAPRGELNIVGIPVQVSGATMIWGKSNADRGMVYPESATVSCGQSFESLYILHTGFFPSESGTAVFDVVLTYADGQSISDSIRFGADSCDFFMNGDAKSQAPTADRSTLAWVALGKANGRDQRISFNMTEVQNPRADQVVEKIELLSAKNATAGCILAITVGKAAMIKPNLDFFR